MFDGILGGNHEEWARQLIGFLPNRDFAFLHGLEQSALDSRGCSIDFVRQQDVGKDGTVTNLESGIILFENLGPKDICWEKIDRKLDTLKGQSKGCGDSVGKKGFADTRRPLQKDVPPRKEGCQNAFYDGGLAYNDFAYGLLDELDSAFHAMFGSVSGQCVIPQ